MKSASSDSSNNKDFNRTSPPSPYAALPVITFADGVTFQVNGEVVKVFHLPNAHTDGDSVVHFTKADVIHTGDLFFNGSYPVIDAAAGGSIDGIIAAGQKIHALASDRTKIIPGHGPLATKADLAAYVKMLETARAKIAALAAAGKTRDEAVAAKPLAELDEVWGKGFMKADTFVGIAYSTLKR